MTVKSKRGRRRYTAFTVPEDTCRQDAEAAVAEVGSAKVITCKAGFAVIRSSPDDRESLERSVTEKLPGSASFDCSGTLSALRSRHPELKSPRKRKR